ncbi:MAG TPA: hypothetical protein VJA19_02285 [Pseudomonas sp.]|nr:hypothetical protein [Pseudomonas sp.]
MNEQDFRICLIPDFPDCAKAYPGYENGSCVSGIGTVTRRIGRAWL